MRDWEDCEQNNSVKKITPDLIRAKSLVETAKERINLITVINEKNANFVFEDYYTSIIEIIQGITFTNGYNILNHVCLGYYLRDKINDARLFTLFDDLRYKRNSLTYYGIRMEFKTAKQAIKNSKIVVKKLLEIYVARKK